MHNPLTDAQIAASSGDAGIDHFAPGPQLPL